MQNTMLLNASSTLDELRISGKEILLLTDVLRGTFIQHCYCHCIHKFDLDALGDDVKEAEHYENVGKKWSVSASALSEKLDQMPYLQKAELLNHIIEAQTFYRQDSYAFLQSRIFAFKPIVSPEPEGHFMVGAALKSGEQVVDRQMSHVKATDTESILHALERISSDNRSFIEEEVQFGGEVGLTECVTTTERDQILYAQRIGRHGLSRFVLGRSAEPCSRAFVVLKQACAHKYVLITGFIGSKPQPEPWDVRAFQHKANPAAAGAESKVFWAGHALVWAPQDIVPGTETSTAPACF